jgi:hypothetical protein
VTVLAQGAEAQTVGRCWLYCRGEGIPVQWIGPVRTPLGEVPMFGCRSCIAELEQAAEQAIRAADMAALVAR